MQKIQRPGDRWTAYEHDGIGNVIRADYYDDTWETFGYDKNGSLLETANEHVTVKLERDSSGQIIKEWQNDLWIASSYDELGSRLQVTSSLGANINVERNSMGNVSQITASRADQAQWTAAMQYNELGQEIERILPGNVISQWQYDITGRPTNHRISSQNRHTRRRVYQWDVNHRLKGMVNELTAGRTTYGYDEFSNLVWSNQGNQFEFLHRNVDDVGNLYETKDKKDRVYGAGSRLLETRDAKFSYDEEGNLVQKVEKNGDKWQYEYYGNGMMSKVIKPDQTEVTFKYDSMGRRMEKCSDEKTMQFVWDGNTILHEYFTENESVELETRIESQNESEIPANLVTWVFNDGFVPSAKITGEGNFSIISDYLGTPVEAYDEEGKKVWAAELDIYGRVEEFTGEKDFIPFRYQGQYDDIEIGIYYNRFRYYDPEQGNYTQQDPIGLAGGNPTLYGFVRNPNQFVDPFGLDICDTSKTLYRGERSSMTPEKAFLGGFSPKGSHNNLEEHLLSNTTAGNFVSTSSSKDIATSFAGKNGYIYEIKTSNYIDVNKSLGAGSPFPEQLEHSIPGGISPNEIVGAHVKQNGALTGEFISNPLFGR